MKLHEEWIDGSWTVDCVCGVKFDDGKEMVNCDECGVWVHTWCSRYVKGDDLFACHKCKKVKKTDIGVSPKLTLRMEGQTMERGLRPRTEVPMEERVHVQGVPGGDLALFESFSSVFSRQLWKCSGYVPKKFSFQYKEFPCWDEKENVCEVADQEDGVADVLLSLSKENDVTNGKETDNDEKIERSCKVREMEMRDSMSVVINKEKRLICRLNTKKARKEPLEASEYRVKKKVKVVYKEEEEEEEDDRKGLVGKNDQLEPLSCPYNAIRRL